MVREKTKGKEEKWGDRVGDGAVGQQAQWTQKARKNSWKVRVKHKHFKTEHKIFAIS